MSHSFRGSIEVFHENDQQALRLLELPPELLACLTSGEDQLVLKSPDDEASGETVLCSTSKTWALRQVQSSNALLLLSRAENTEGNSMANAMSIYASSNGTIEAMELKSASKNLKDATGFLLELLPVYDGVDTLMPSSALSRTEVVRKVPRSNREIEEAWRDLAAFETEDKCFRLSSKFKLKVWKDINRVAAAVAIDLSKPFTPKDILAAALPEINCPQSAYEALIWKLSSTVSAESDLVQLEKDTTVMNVRDWLVSGLGPGGAATDQFLGVWRSLLPEVWQADVSQDKIRLPAVAQDLSTRELESAKAPDTDAKVGNKRKAGQRNWHERFKRTR